MFQCRVCEQLFYSTVDCAAHVENQHSDSSPDECIPVRYHCNVCGQIFGHVVDCKNHALREHGMQKPDCRQVAG